MESETEMDEGMLSNIAFKKKLDYITAHIFYSLQISRGKIMLRTNIFCNEAQIIIKYRYPWGFPPLCSKLSNFNKYSRILTAK